MYEIRTETVNGREYTYYTAEDQTWTDEDKTKLRDQENMIYAGGIFAVKITDCPDHSLLYTLYMEDDGTLYETNVSFVSCWSSDLVKVLKLADLDASGSTMKIIRHGNIPRNNSYRFECNICGCVWLVDSENLQRDQQSIIYTPHCDCPECGAKGIYGKRLSRDGKSI